MFFKKNKFMLLFIVVILLISSSNALAHSWRVFTVVKGDNYTNYFRQNKNKMSYVSNAYLMGVLDKSYTRSFSFQRNEKFDMIIQYAGRGKHGSYGAFWLQEYDNGWKTIYYKKITGAVGYVNEQYNRYRGDPYLWPRGNKKLTNLNSGTYRFILKAYSSNGYGDREGTVGVQYGIITSPKPQIQTSSITFNEGEKSSKLIKVGGGEGEVSYSTSGVPNGMTFSKVSNGYQATWKPGYDVNKNKSSSKVVKKFNLTVTDSKGESETKNINVYVNNQPKPIDNIDNYKTISDLPVKPVDTELEKPELPVFDEDGNLSSKNMFTDINNYTFVEVEEKAPYPGNEPNVIAKIKTSLVEGNNQDIHNSLFNGNVEGYKDFTSELSKYNQARDAYKDLEDLLENQYGEQDNDELFFDNLKELIEYNNKNNYLGEKIDLTDYKDYDNMKALYELLKNKLQTRQGKLDENIKQYNKYVKAVEEYNLLLENKLDLLINNYKNDYIPKYESWKTDKLNYLNNLQSKVQEYNLYNQNIYNQKVEEIANNIDQYGLVSLKVDDINKPPNLNAHYLSEINKFDLNEIDNIYGSIKDYPYLNEEIKTSIKNKFNDGVYNEEKFDWLKNIMLEDLNANIKKSTTINEKYLIK